MEVLARTASQGSFRDRPLSRVLQHGSLAIQFASRSLDSLTNNPACTLDAGRPRKELVLSRMRLPIFQLSSVTWLLVVEAVDSGQPRS